MKKVILSTLLIGTFLFGSTLSVEAKTIRSSNYGPTALCRDGTYSYAANHRGACSWHKGVKTWYK